MAEDNSAALLLSIKIDGATTTFPLVNAIALNVVLAPRMNQGTTGGGQAMLIQGTHAVININALKDQDTPFDLTDSTIELIIAAADTKAFLSLPAKILNAKEGKACFYLLPEHLPTGGSYEYQAVVTFPDKTTARTAISAFYVAESLQPAIS